MQATLLSLAWKRKVLTLQLRKLVIKTEHDHIRLPNLFTLPKHYQVNVKTGLRNREITSEASKSFLSSVNLLKAEFKRKKRNETVVSNLMKRTLPLRRQTTLEKPMNLD